MHESMCKILMSICKRINAYAYSEKICVSDEIGSQCVCTSRGYHMHGRYCMMFMATPFD